MKTDMSTSETILKGGVLWLLVAASCFFCTPGFAQYDGYRSVSNLDAFKQRFKTESAKVLSIESSFVQDKVLTALTEKITSRGKFWFKRSNRVRIEYVSPFTYTMIMNGDKLLLRDGQKENRVNVKSNKLFQQVNRIVLDCVQGTMLESKDFSVRYFEDDKSFLMELTPTTKIMLEFFQTIVLKVDNKNFSVNSIEMIEQTGDRTTISFLDKKINTQFADAVFAL
jgi:outer membrane lipoprotein-sorting protein